MHTLPPWLYNEFRHVGVDYSDETVAEGYDGFHTSIRGDMAAASEALLDKLQVTAGHTLVDLGCGTGTFAIQAAKRCAAVAAVDVAPAMLAVARQKAEAAGVTNVTFHHAGFLTYAHQDAPVDVVTSTAAMHHLPDFWKLIGLRRIAGMLKEGGLFYLMDTVYSFAPENYAEFFAEKSALFARLAGEDFGQETLTAFREEFSTCDWIMEGLLTRAGLVIEQAEYQDGLLAHYICRKVATTASAVSA